MLKRNFIKTIIGAGICLPLNLKSEEHFEDIAKKIKYWLENKTAAKITFSKNDDLYHIINLIHNNDEFVAIRGIGSTMAISLLAAYQTNIEDKKVYLFHEFYRSKNNVIKFLKDQGIYNKNILTYTPDYLGRGIKFNDYTCYYDKARQSDKILKEIKECFGNLKIISCIEDESVVKVTKNGVSKYYRPSEFFEDQIIFPHFKLKKVNYPRIC